MKLKLFENINLNYVINSEQSEVKFIKLFEREYKIILNIGSSSKKCNENNNVIVKSTNENENLKENILTKNNVKKDNDDLFIENIFSETKFKEFREFCKFKKIKLITEITNDDIINFKWTKNLNRLVLREITRRINQYEYEYGIRRTTKELEEVRKKICAKLYKLTDKQKIVGEFIVKNLETIVEIESLNDFSDIIGVSNTTISIVLTRLNLGSFSTFKNYLLKVI